MARDSERSSRRSREDTDREGDHHRHHRDEADDPRGSKDDNRRRRRPSPEPSENLSRARESVEHYEERGKTRGEGRRRSPEDRDRDRDSAERGEERRRLGGIGRQKSPEGRDRRRDSVDRGEEWSRDERRRGTPEGRDRRGESTERIGERSKVEGRRRSPEGRDQRPESAEHSEEQRGVVDDVRRQLRRSRERESVERNDSRQERRSSVERMRRQSREESVERFASKKRKERGREQEPADGTGEKRMLASTEAGDRKRERKEDYGSKERREERMEKERKSKDERKERGREQEPGDYPRGKRVRESVERGDERQDRWREDNVLGESQNVRKEERRSKDEKKRKRGFKEEVKEEQLSDGDGIGEMRAGGKQKDESRDIRREESMNDNRLKVDVKDEVFGDDDAEVEMLRKSDHGKTGFDGDAPIGDRGSSGAKGFAPELLSKASEPVQNTYAVSGFHLPTKVSSVTTTIENGLINRADEVHGKSSTDGATTSMPGKSGSLSLDALAKAKKALQMQKMLSEKLKKIPMIAKPSSSNADGRLQMETVKGTQKVPLFAAHTPSSAQPYSGLGNSGGIASSSNPSDATVGIPSLSGLNVEAVKRAQEVAARMGFRQDPQFAPLINMFPGSVPDVSIHQKPSKAPVLRLDAQGREIDEHGNVINMPKFTNLSTLKVNINKQKKEAFQILKPDLDANLESNPFFDQGLGINKSKLLRLKRPTFQFVEEGKWSRQAEITRFKSQFGEAQAKELKTKQAQLARAKAEPDINPNLIELSERIFIKEKQKEHIPDAEWWDTLLLPSGKYDDVTDDKINFEKISIYVVHPLPIEPPAEPAPPPPQPLKLTKKETKKLRTQRRLAKERDRQEMIRQGLIEPPKPKVKMSNLMKVLGSEATQDPTKVEMEIRSAAAEREQAHVDRNIARKLTPAERREKKEKKLFEDPNTLETFVTVYKVNSLTHPKARFQVDVNAQENRLSGCAVISDGICVVVVEGGRKSNKRYKNLMLKRIDWAAAAENEEDDTDNMDAPLNRCHLIWTGSVAKPSFNRFLIHQCRTEAAARKVFVDAGVPHYWDLAVNFTDEMM